MSKRTKKIKAVEEEVVVTGKRQPAEPISLNKSEQKALDGLSTTSAKIRYLATLNYSHGQIAAFLGIRHQHARNVLTTVLKRPAK